MKTLLLTAAALLTFSVPAFAQSKLTLPEGSWGKLAETPGNVPKCSPKPFLTIKDKTITISMSAGRGICKIKALKMEKPYIIGKFNCEWDKSIPPEQLVAGDGDEDDFSVIIQSENKLLYNNVLMGRCPGTKSVAE